MLCLDLLNPFSVAFQQFLNLFHICCLSVYYRALLENIRIRVIEMAPGSSLCDTFLKRELGAILIYVDGSLCRRKPEAWNLLIMIKHAVRDGIARMNRYVAWCEKRGSIPLT
jgi:hypothetical protein